MLNFEHEEPIFASIKQKGVLEQVSKLNKFSSFDVKKLESACLGDYHGGSVNSGDFPMLSLPILAHFWRNRSIIENILCNFLLIT